MRKTLATLASIAFAAGLVWLDHATGPHIRFAILFPVPVALASSTTAST